MCSMKWFFTTKHKLNNINYIYFPQPYLYIYCILQCRGDVILVRESEAAVHIYTWGISSGMCHICCVTYRCPFLKLQGKHICKLFMLTQGRILSEINDFISRLRTSVAVPFSQSCKPSPIPSPWETNLETGKFHFDIS